MGGFFILLELKATNKKAFGLLILLLLAFVANSASQTRKRLSEGEAIQKAEEFIVMQGYTDLPPTKDKRKWVPESVNPGTDVIGMKLRHDSLERKAYGVVRENGKSGAWWVVFRYNKTGNAELRRMFPDFIELMQKWGRAVIIDAYGRDARLEHQDFNLQFEKLKRIER